MHEIRCSKYQGNSSLHHSSCFHADRVRADRFACLLLFHGQNSGNEPIQTHNQKSLILYDITLELSVYRAFDERKNNSAAVQGIGREEHRPQSRKRHFLFLLCF